MGSRSAWTPACRGEGSQVSLTVPQEVDQFKGSTKRWVVAVVLVRGAGVAAAPAPRSNNQSCRIVKWRWPGRSDDQRAFKVEWFLEANVLDPRSDVLVQGIDAKAVLLGIDDREKPFTQEDPLGRADQALEDR